MAMPYQADHVGSFLRPQGLLDARRAHEAGPADHDALRAAEDTAIRDTAAVQQAAGTALFSDRHSRRARRRAARSSSPRRGRSRPRRA